MKPFSGGGAELESTSIHHSEEDSDLRRVQRRLRALGFIRLVSSLGWLSAAVPLLYWNGWSILPATLVGSLCGVGLFLLKPGTLPRLVARVTGMPFEPDRLFVRMEACAAQRRKPYLTLLADLPFVAFVTALLAARNGTLVPLSPVAYVITLAAAAGHVWSVAVGAQDLQVAAELRRQIRDSA